MLKPLIRTIPNLSGNVKISCNLSNFKKINNDLFECCVRYAKLLPLSNVLAEKFCEAKLMNSSYEFDLKNFYKIYPDIFYTSQFTYSKDIYGDVDFSKELKNRDKDFEFGLKRISYTKNNGSQFAFFAPIWIESENDLPDYFLLHIKIDKYENIVEKTIKIKINDVNKTDRFNYLSLYLNKYAKKINNNVIFCTPSSNQATYFGIDLINGGFVKKIDNLIGKNYRFQSTINKFDLNITEGFKRNKICIKQIIPLCFTFSLEDILTPYEISKYGNAKIQVYGDYWKNEQKIKMYDFSTDYTKLSQKSWLLKNGKFAIQDTKQNIMNMEFPSLMEASYQGYEHFNKIQKECVRWKLKYSNDNYPYITNFSPAFSIAQQSSCKYREFPSLFYPISVYDDNNNNIMSPLTKTEFYDNDIKTVNRYKTIMQNNASNWFNVAENTEKYTKRIVYNLADLKSNNEWYFKVKAEDINDYIPISYNGNTSNIDAEYFENLQPDNEFTGELYVRCSDHNIREMEIALSDESNPQLSYVLYEKHTMFDKPENWANVINNKVYFNGILYDFSTIYEQLPNTKHIDKFGVFVDPEFNKIQEDKLSQIKAAHFTLFNDRKYFRQLNAVQSNHLAALLLNQEDYSPIYMSEASIGKRMNEVSHDSLFFENTSYTTDGQFLDLAKIGYDVYDLNLYFEFKELLKKYPEVISLIEQKREERVIKGCYQLPIYRLQQVSFDNRQLWFETYKYQENLWIKNNLVFNVRNNYSKGNYDKKTFYKLFEKYDNSILECPLMIESEFVSMYTLKNLFDNETIESIYANCRHYMFNPIMVDQNEAYSINVFTEIKLFDKNYGDYLPENRIYEDLNFIYVDPYNMANVMGEDWDNTWLTDDLYSVDFYAKFLNKIHFKIYLNETYKDENSEYQYPFIEKIDSLYVKRRIFFNDSENEQTHLKDFYIKVLDFYKDDFDVEQLTIDEYRKIASNIFYDIMFDEESGLWYFSDDFASTHDIYSLLGFTENDPVLPKYYFEFTFKKRFLKVNKAIWEKINIDNKHEFTDLYLYRIQQETEYPAKLKYYCTYDLSLFDSTEDTYNILTPLFTNVFKKQQKVSTIYSEYNQSKVTYAQYGDEQFYRYNSDNTPFVLDISNIDTTHHLIYGANSIAYYSYAYLNNLEMSYDPYVIDEAYKYVNRIDQYSGTISYLPTLNMIEKAESNIKLACGTKQVLQYYSDLSYNYIDHIITENTSYYSPYQYSRIDFDAFDHDLHIRLGEYAEVDLGDGTFAYSYSYEVFKDDVKTYYDLHSRYIPEDIIYDDLGIYNDFGISTYVTTYTYNSYYTYTFPVIETAYTDDGLISYEVITYKTTTDYETKIGYCTYGMIYINAKFNNTNTSFNLIDKYHNDKKYFTYIKNHDIYSNHFSIQNCFQEFVPFIKTNLFNTLKTYNYVVEPFVNSINAYICPVRIENRKSYDIIINNRPLCNITLERYFDSITPLITEVSTMSNTYMIKLENSERHTYPLKDKDESVLYNENINIYANTGSRIYSNKFDYERVFQLEEKHFNDNYNVNLESKISIKIGDSLTYEEMIDAERYENVLKVFAMHVRKNGNYTEDEILFLYNKYNVNYDSYSTGIDYLRTCKLYSLTIIFNLI